MEGSDNQFMVSQRQGASTVNMRNFRLIGQIVGLMGQKSCESVDNVDASEIRLTR